MADRWSVARLQRETRYWRPAILLTAAHLDLFGWFGKRKLKADAVAAHYGGNRIAWESYLNALRAMGLLRKHGELFHAPEFARRHLTGDPRDLLLADYDAWSAWGELATVLTKARRPRAQWPFVTDRVGSARLLHALDLHARLIAPYLVPRLDLARAKTFLDVGGGLGSYASAFCRRYPRLRAMVVEHPQVAPLARQAIAAAGMTKRVRVLGRDITRTYLPGNIDAALLSNLLHSHSERENLFMLRQIHQCLVPGGQLIVRDVFMREDRARPEWGALFSVALLLHTPRGRCYTLAEIRAWLKDVGFSPIRGPLRSSPLPFDPDALLIARKAP